MSPKDVVLDLSGQNLKLIPDSVFERRDITYLNLGSRQITFYPPLSALVDSNNNDISHVPEKIGELTSLKILNLNSNKLKTLPNAIIKLSNLEVLDLSINRDLDIVEELDKLKQLPNLKVLKIVDVKLNRDKLKMVKASLRPDTKVIATISEYMATLK